MMLELSNEQRQALGAAKVGPVCVVDPVTQTRYVLISDAEYERVRPLVEEVPFDAAEAYPLMDEVARKEGWDEPEMDAYDRLDPRRAP